MSNTIIRARRRHRFVILDQRAVEDTRLSWAARGLLGYLLSRPDDWKVLVRDLRRRGDLGRDGIYSLLRELRAAGYVRFERARDHQGRLRGGTYYVHEVPATPLPDGPDAVAPEAAAPDPADPHALPTTQSELTTTTTTTPTNTQDSRGDGCRSIEDDAAIEFPAWVPPDVQASALRWMAGLDERLAQEIIDEWAGIVAAGAIRSSVIGCLRGLISRAQEGLFSPERAPAVAAAREAARGSVSAGDD